MCITGLTDTLCYTFDYSNVGITLRALFCLLVFMTTKIGYDNTNFPKELNEIQPMPNKLGYTTA